MAGRIPSEFIDELLGRVDIHDVVNARVPLRKAGHEYKACCPFHDENTPSFTVSPRKQFYHCFGCGAHGSAIGFLMEYDKLEFLEAVQELASVVGLEVPRLEERAGPEVSTGRLSEQKRLLDVLQRANAYFKKQLRVHPDAGKAIDYLKSRGLSGEICRDYEVGFAPPEWRSLSQAVASGEQERNLLLAAGLVKSKGSSEWYDRFRNRITFPIYDRRGRIVGFGGRSLDGENPKYLNSPETAVFQKGEVLYGLHQVLSRDRQPDQILVVEGYLDVIALAQFGLGHVVATLGTALTSAHLRQLFRVTENVVFCFDGDEAGRRAADKALRTALPEIRAGRQVFFLFLPEGEDPDTLIRSIGAEEFRKRMDTKVPLSEFFFSQLQVRTDVSTLDGQARLAEIAKPLVDAIPEGAFRSKILQRLSELTHLGQQQLSGGASRVVAKPRTATARLQPPSTYFDKALRSLLQAPALGAHCDQDTVARLREFPEAELLIAILDYIRQHGSPTPGLLIEQFRDTKWHKRVAELTIPAQSLYSVEEFQHTFPRLLKELETRYNASLGPEAVAQRLRSEYKQ